MWESILNYSVYTVSHCGNGQSITDGGPGASTQQVTEANKVKEPHQEPLLRRLIVPWEAINSLISQIQPRQPTSYRLPQSTTETHRRDQRNRHPPQFQSNDNLFNEVKHGSEHIHHNCGSVAVVFCYKSFEKLLSLPKRCFCRFKKRTKWLCENQFHDWAVA